MVFCFIYSTINLFKNFPKVLKLFVYVEKEGRQKKYMYLEHKYNLGFKFRGLQMIIKYKISKIKL